MTDLTSQNLDVIAAEVAYRHHAGIDTDQHARARGSRWLRRHRRTDGTASASTRAA